MTNVDILNATAAGVVIDQVPGRTRLYDQTGKSIDVEDQHVPYWLSLGFRRAPIDLDETFSAFQAALPPAEQAIVQLIQATKTTQIIDLHAFAVAETALRELVQAGADILLTVQRGYPVPQQDGE